MKKMRKEMVILFKNQSLTQNLISVSLLLGVVKVMPPLISNAADFLS